MNATSEILEHASGISIDGMGVIICGPSGSGKSDMALRLIDRGAALVSDDSVMLTVHNDRVQMDSPTAIRGKIELRSLGIFELPYVRHIPLYLKIDLDPEPERFPFDRQIETISGVQVHRISLNPWEQSAPIKVEMALARLIRLEGHS